MVIGSELVEDDLILTVYFAPEVSSLNETVLIAFPEASTKLTEGLSVSSFFIVTSTSSYPVSSTLAPSGAVA